MLEIEKREGTPFSGIGGKHFSITGICTTMNALEKYSSRLVHPRQSFREQRTVDKNGLPKGVPAFEAVKRGTYAVSNPHRPDGNCRGRFPPIGGQPPFPPCFPHKLPHIPYTPATYTLLQPQKPSGTKTSTNSSQLSL